MRSTAILVLLFVACALAKSGNNSHVPSSHDSSINHKRSLSNVNEGVTARTWTWPYPASSSDSRNILGVILNTNNINMGGTGTNVAIVNPGSSVSFSFNWNSHRVDAGYCPGCVVQWYWGMSFVNNPSNPASGSDTPVRFCYNMGTWYGHNSDLSGSYGTTFTAPTVPGMHYFQIWANLDYVCYDFIGFGQCPQNSFAAICVSGDTDGDGVDDCFDACPCTSASNCPFIASTPSTENIQCNEAPEGTVTTRNDYCGASRASTGFISGVTETTNATGSCPETFVRTFAVSDSCDGSTQYAYQTVRSVSSCDSSVTSIHDATATISAVDDWGYDGAGNPQYRAIVNVNFPSSTNDWRVAIELPSNGDRVVSYGSYYSVYSGAQYVCGTLEPAAFTVSPAGAWAASQNSGGSVTFEYVATNTGNLALNTVAAASTLRVYRTASS